MATLFGDVHWLVVAYTDGSGSKRRPVVVVSGDSLNALRRDVVVMALTSKKLPLTSFPGELVVEDWQAANLRGPSAVKPVFATFQQDILPPKEGCLSKKDQTRLRAHLPSILG